MGIHVQEDCTAMQWDGTRAGMEYIRQWLTEDTVSPHHGHKPGEPYVATLLGLAIARSGNVTMVTPGDMVVEAHSGLTGQLEIYALPMGFFLMSYKALETEQGITPEGGA